MRASHRRDRCLDLAPGQHPVHADIPEHHGCKTCRQSRRDGDGRRGLARQQKPVAPSNIRLRALPPYAPERNAVEHLWDELREKCFHNKVVASLDALEDDLTMGPLTMENTPEVILSITNWP